mmetsp:Transcript_9556/g.35421  ORF Transcript_9556/g.35421 Transcript_9556/m.35421 type:complete len:319 (+) Transcript_9556:1819-2775(+)
MTKKSMLWIKGVCMSAQGSMLQNLSEEWTHVEDSIDLFQVLRNRENGLSVAQSSIHLVNLLFGGLVYILALQFHRRCQKSVRRIPLFRANVNILDVLKRLLVVCPGNLVKFVQDGHLDFRFPDQLLQVVKLNVTLFGPLHKNWRIRVHESHNVTRLRVPVDCQSVREHELVVGSIHSLQCLQGNIFSMRHFDQILDTISNFDLAIRGERSNITSLEPSILSEHRLGLIWQFVVSTIYIGTTYENLSNIVLDKIVHVWNILQTNLIGRNWWSNLTWTQLPRCLNSSTTASLSESVSLQHVASQNSVNEFLSFWIEWSTT